MKVELTLPNPPPPPKGYKWVYKGFGYKSDKKINYAHHHPHTTNWHKRKGKPMGAKYLYYLVAEPIDGKLSCETILGEDLMRPLFLHSKEESILTNCSTTINADGLITKVNDWTIETLIENNIRWSNNGYSYTDANPFTTENHA